ncbi:hypothetical protein EGW08_004934 [Elysia chlorotica]|uniref:Uncharacterized protein n=1 Tax=Elysia chlorotica TaxID=188477 RepID=A0A3S1CAD7_ELYCH|nr:hypothetical protein EGW08_004934 [Elysia chlorotica]
MARPPEADLESAMSIMKLLRAPPQGRACAYSRRAGFAEHNQPHQQQHPHHHHLHHHNHHQSRQQQHQQQQQQREPELRDGGHMSQVLSQQRHMSHPLELTRGPGSGYASAFSRSQTVPNPSCMETLGSANNASGSKFGRSARGGACLLDSSEPRGNGDGRGCGSGGNSDDAHQRRSGSTFGSSNRSPPGVGHRRPRPVFSKSNTPSPCDDVFVM